MYCTDSLLIGASITWAWQPPAASDVSRRRPACSGWRTIRSSPGCPTLRAPHRIRSRGSSPAKFFVARSACTAPERRMITTADLLTASTLAAALPGHGRNGKRSSGYVSAMKAAGYVFAYGPYTTLSHALKWLAANPDFRTTRYRQRVPGFEGKKARRPSDRASSTVPPPCA